MDELKMKLKRFTNSSVLSSSTRDKELGTNTKSNSNRKSGGKTSVQVKSTMTTSMVSTALRKDSLALSKATPEPLALGRSTVWQ